MILKLLNLIFIYSRLACSLKLLKNLTLNNNFIILLENKFGRIVLIFTVTNNLLIYYEFILLIINCQILNYK